MLYYEDALQITISTKLFCIAKVSVLWNEKIISGLMEIMNTDI